MNRIVNKALLYKEWLSVRWMTLLITLTILFLKIYNIKMKQFSNQMALQYSPKVMDSRWFSDGLCSMSIYNIVMIILIILLSITLFMNEKNSASQGFIASMPFTRKDIILNKLIAGILSIVISFAVTYIVLSLLYLIKMGSFNPALNPYTDIVKMVLIDASEYICIFTFFVLVQTVMGNGIVAGVVGGILMAAPLILITVVLDLIHKNTEPYSIVFQRWSTIYSFNIVSFGMSNGPRYTYYGVRLLTLFILTCLFAYSAYSCFNKRNLEYNLRLVAFKRLKPVFKCTAALLTGLIAGDVFRLGSLNKLAFFILLIIFGAAGYFLSCLLLKEVRYAK